jgi:hypothetical protein
LKEQLEINDGGSMMEHKRLMNAPLRDGRMLAVYNAMDALAERFVDGAPMKRFEEKRKMMEGKLIPSGADVHRCSFRLGTKIKMIMRFAPIKVCAQPFMIPFR